MMALSFCTASHIDEHTTIGIIRLHVDYIHRCEQQDIHIHACMCARVCVPTARKQTLSHNVSTRDIVVFFLNPVKTGLTRLWEVQEAARTTLATLEPLGGGHHRH